MRPPERESGSANRWAIATPSGVGRLPGVRMAGFDERSGHALDLDVVPYPAITVAIDLAGTLVVDSADDGRRERGSVVYGLAPSRLTVRGAGVACLQLRMSPVVAHAVLGSTSDLGQAVAPLDAVWGREARMIEDRIRSAPTWDARFALAEEAIVGRLESGPRPDPEVAAAWAHLTASEGRLRVDDVAADLGWSRKRLWSRFRSQVGVTPKLAARLIRFDAAVHRLASGDRPAEVAAEAGYADQSHLHREVGDFTSLTPSAAASAPWLAVDDVAWARSD